MMIDDPPEEIRQVSMLANRLGKIASILRTVGIFVIIITASHVFVFALTAARFFPSILTMQFSAISSAATFIFLVFFDVTRRNGEIIYGEISDYTDNYTKQYRNKSRRIKPDLEFNLKNDYYINDDYDFMSNFQFRMSVKKFANAIEMPLVPGKFGPAIFVLFNFIMLITVIILSRIDSPIFMR